MNIKKQAQKLENFLEDEFKKQLPVAILSDGSLVYKNFRIKQDKQGIWNLYRVKGNHIDSFNLKACALLAAKYYSVNEIRKYREIQSLDQSYQKHQSDADVFKHIYTKTKDLVKKDNSLWRWEISNHKAKYAKQQIVSKFKLMF